MTIYRYCSCGAPIYNKKAQKCRGCIQEETATRIARMQGRVGGMDGVRFEQGINEGWRKK